MTAETNIKQKSGSTRCCTRYINQVSTMQQRGGLLFLVGSHSPDGEKLCSRLDDGIERIREVRWKSQHVVDAKTHLLHQVVHLETNRTIKQHEAGDTIDTKQGEKKGITIRNTSSSTRLSRKGEK